MKIGTIQNLIRFYQTEDVYVGEFKRAQKEFMEDKTDNVVIVMDERIEPFFNEWFVYDFKLDNGLTILEDFYTNNPLKFSEKELKAYRCLQENNYYGMLEVRDVKKGEGLELLNLTNKKIYQVKENRLTYQVEKGDIFFNRIAKVDKHWELVGTDSFLLGVSLGDNLRYELLREKKEKITPKKAVDFLFNNKNRDKEDMLDKKINIKEENEKFSKQIKKLGIDKYIINDKIKKIIKKEAEKDEKDNERISGINEIISILVGLINEDDFDDKEINELVSCIANIHNAQIPKERIEKAKKENKKRNLRFEKSIVANKRWINHANKSTELLHEGDYIRALKEANESFECLLKDKTSYSEIYRLYANKGIIHLALGERKKGLKFLNIALELNSNYDFAIDTMEKYKKGAFDDLIEKGFIIHSEDESEKTREKFIENELKNDPGIVYYNYFKKFNINLKTKELTTSKIYRKLNGRKIGRNDSCICGAKKDDGTPIKYKKCCGK